MRDGAGVRIRVTPCGGCTVTPARCVLLLQVGSLIIFWEYERSRKKEIQKQQKEAAERQGIIERARLEREVSRGTEWGGMWHAQ